MCKTDDACQDAENQRKLGISEFIRHSEDDPGMYKEIRDSEEVGISSKL